MSDYLDRYKDTLKEIEPSDELNRKLKERIFKEVFEMNNFIKENNTNEINETNEEVIVMSKEDKQESV